MQDVKIYVDMLLLLKLHTSELLVIWMLYILLRGVKQN